jgi:hypothetical protein
VIGSAWETVFRILLGKHFRRRPRGQGMRWEDNIKMICTWLNWLYVYDDGTKSRLFPMKDVQP